MSYYRTFPNALHNKFVLIIGGVFCAIALLVISSIVDNKAAHAKAVAQIDEGVLLYHPVFVQKIDVDSTLYVHNSSNTPANYTIQFVGIEGDVVMSAGNNIAPGSVNSHRGADTQTPIDGLYYIVMSSDSPLSSIVRIFDKTSQTLSLYRGIPDPTASTTFHFGPFFNTAERRSTLYLQNTSISPSATITVTAIDIFGDEWSGSWTNQADGHSIISADSPNLNLPADFTGWLQVTSDQPHIGVLAPTSGEDQIGLYSPALSAGAAARGYIPRIYNNVSRLPTQRETEIYLVNTTYEYMIAEVFLDLYDFTDKSESAYVTTEGIDVRETEVISSLSRHFFEIEEGSLATNHVSLDLYEITKAETEHAMASYSGTTFSDDTAQLLLSLPYIKHGADSHSIISIQNAGDTETELTIEFSSSGGADGPITKWSDTKIVAPNRSAQIDTRMDSMFGDDFIGSVRINSTNSEIVAYVDEYMKLPTPIATPDPDATPTPLHPEGWDLSFGENGQAETNCNHIALQPDNKILCPVGNETNTTFLFRLLENGAIDSDFGSSGRIVLDDVDGILGAAIPSIVTQSTGHIVLADTKKMLRFAEDGAPDLAFGEDGQVNLTSDDYPLGWGYPRLLVQEDDKLVVYRQHAEDVAGLARFTPEGVLDMTFNGTGYMPIVQLAPNSPVDAVNRLESVALYPDNKLIVSFFTTWQEDDDPFADPKTFTTYTIVRLNSDGSRDLSFGEGGQYESRLYENVSTKILNLAILENGQILVSSNSVIRLQPDGTLDDSATFPTFEKVFEDPHNRLLFYSKTAMSSVGWVTRYFPDGSQDESWDWTDSIARYLTGAYIRPDGGLLVRIIEEPNTYPQEYFWALNLASTIPPGTPINPPVLPEPEPLTLLYAVLDNNLGEDWTRLVNNVESGMRPGMNVRLLVDGPGTDDVYLYDIVQDNNPFCPSLADPTCGARYVEGTNFWQIDNENSAHPDSLYQFIVDGINAHEYISTINLALIGHGSGWSANVLPGQPSYWRDQNDTVGGMLWDDHPSADLNESRSLSTRALANALKWAGEETQRNIDLLYLDGCSMGMIEVAVELKESAQFLLASPNIDWASFSYDILLPETVSVGGADLGERWLAIEAAGFRANEGHPFASSLTDLSQMDLLTTAASGLADALRGSLPANRSQIEAAFARTDRFDSDYNGELNSLDSYIDLGDFATQLQYEFTNDATVINAIDVLSQTISVAVLATESEDGTPWVHSDQVWSWKNYTGLGVYAPLEQDETRRALFYNGNNLAWAADTNWDEFLSDFWAGGVQAAQRAEMPVCRRTTDGCAGLATQLPIEDSQSSQIYVPLMQR